MPIDLSTVSGAVRASMPRSFKPMKLVEVAKPFARKGWSFELKLDGFRCLAFVSDGNVRILSGYENEAHRQFPEIVASLATWPGT